MFNQFMNLLAAVDSTKVTKTVTKQTNVWMRFIENIDWDKIFSVIITKSISFVLICLAFTIINSVGKKLIRRVILHTSKKDKHY